MSAPRKLDYNEACRLHNAGFGYAEIGRRLGVHHTTVMYAVDQAFRRRKLRGNAERRGRAAA